MTETTDITVYEKINDPIEAATKLGQMFASSGLFGCTKLEQGQVLALACISERKSPFELMRTYHLFNGKLEMKASAMLARFKELGGKCQWQSDLMDREKASAKFTFEENEMVSTYTIKDAELEGLTGKTASGKDRTNWERATPDMLRARLIAKTIRMIAPQVNSGIYDSAEIPEGGGKHPAEDRSLLSREAPQPSETLEERRDDSTDGIPDLSPENGGPPKSKQPSKVVDAEIIDEGGPSDPFATDVIEENPRVALIEKAGLVIGDREEQANAFLLSKKQINPGGTWRDGPDSLLTRIVSRPDAFLAAITR